MEFYTVSDTKRPIRLCEKTRKFAYDSLNCKYGRNAKETPCVSLDSIKDFEKKTNLEKYDIAINEIVTKAPVRICENELISGAATLGDAIHHIVPAKYKGEPVFESISHLTLGFDRVLKIGINGIREQIEKSTEHHTDKEKLDFLLSCKHCVDYFEIWHKRYLDALKNKPNYEKVYNNLLKVPLNPATNFYEAVQSLWFTFAFTRLCGNWPGIGRIDVMLGKYLKDDLSTGRLTIDEAREILAHFFIKGCEWIIGERNAGSGDAQHYQNIVLSGIDADGNDVTNEVTYLVLDIVEELGISDFPITVRVNKNTDEQLLSKVSEVIKHGGGVVAIYNEDLIIESLTEYGYPKNEVFDFANDGCWEVQIPGKTNFIYTPFDALRILQHDTLSDYENIHSFADFDELYNKYIEDLGKMLEYIFRVACKRFEEKEITDNNWKWKEATPCTVVSLFEDDCIGRGLSYLMGGTVYNVVSPHIGGVTDAANSLYAIKKLVFDEKKLTFDEFMEILKNDWQGEEALRKYVLNHYKYYGNDNDEVDEIVSRILSDFSKLCSQFDGRTPIKFPSGVSTFGRQIEWSEHRMSSPHGRKKGEVLAANMSPTPGTDIEGATAIIKSYCKADLKKQVTGAALDLKIFPTCVSGDKKVLSNLIRSFVSLGGFFVQPDIIDAQILKEAQKNPENYKTLSVRVSGWNARFVTLNKEWQDMVIGNISKKGI